MSNFLVDGLESHPAVKSVDLPFAVAGDRDWDNSSRIWIVDTAGNAVARFVGTDCARSAQLVSDACNSWDLLVDALHFVSHDEGSTLSEKASERVLFALRAAGFPDARVSASRDDPRLQEMVTAAKAATTLLRAAYDRRASPNQFDAITLEAVESITQKVERSLK